jgi:uncharacterized protein YjiS (DUF1127 family)
MDGSSWVEPRLDQTPRRMLPARIIGALSVWRARARQRGSLAALSDRDLRDIGITRVEQRRECAKPFWRP